MRDKIILDLTTDQQEDKVIMNMSTYQQLLTELGEDQADFQTVPTRAKSRTKDSEIFNCEQALSKVSYGTHSGLRFPTHPLNY